MKHISPEHDIYELDLIVGTDLLFGLGVNLRNVSKLMKKISYGTLNVVDVYHRKFFNNRIIVNPISSSFSKNVCIIPLFSAAEEFSSLGNAGFIQRYL
ncbi:WSSV521 [White spot syndrome virus]|uniref:WSSV521 n=1 Tax=White spot syndrome virus TaxID=342409 RepID=A0A2I6SCJ5_9VIRU|nr:WSSV521 [White spot syndrome virus]